MLFLKSGESMRPKRKKLDDFIPNYVEKIERHNISGSCTSYFADKKNVYTGLNQFL